jgi:hypothetical protein
LPGREAWKNRASRAAGDRRSRQLKGWTSEDESAASDGSRDGDRIIPHNTGGEGDGAGSPPACTHGNGARDSAVAADDGAGDGLSLLDGLRRSAGSLGERCDGEHPGGGSR